jgi:hypothetical protein
VVWEAVGLSAAEVSHAYEPGCRLPKIGRPGHREVGLDEPVSRGFGSLRTRRSRGVRVRVDPLEP